MALPSLPRDLGRPAAAGGPSLAGLLRPASLGSTTRDGLPQAVPNQPFLYRHYARNWRLSQHLEVPVLLPVLKKHIIAPGVNGNRTLRRGEEGTPALAYRNAVRDALDVGWVYLDPDRTIGADLLPEGVAAGPYIRELEVQHPKTRAAGLRFIEAWDVPHNGLPGDPVRFVFDRVTYERWLASLLVDGQIEPCADYVREGHLATLEKRVDRAKGLPMNSDVRDERVQAAQEALDTYRDALAMPDASIVDRPAEDASKAKRTRRNRSTADV